MSNYTRRDIQFVDTRSDAPEQYIGEVGFVTYEPPVQIGIGMPPVLNTERQRVMIEPVISDETSSTHMLRFILSPGENFRVEDIREELRAVADSILEIANDPAEAVRTYQFNNH